MFNSCQMVYHYGNCLNTKKAFVRPCKRCIDHCPHSALSTYKEVNAELCTECGLCMAVCPSDGMVESGINQLEDYLFSSDRLVLNCPQTLPAGFEINCLGIFDEDGWKTLLLLSEQRQVEIYVGDCSTCPDKPACEHSANLLKQLLGQWQERTALKIIVKPEWTEDEIPKKNPTTARKSAEEQGLIAGLRKKSLAKLEELLPDITSDETYPIPKTRQWLFRALQNSPDRKVPFAALKINEQCTSCQVCSAICPQGALTSIKDESQNKYKIAYEPLKCVQCRRCVETCQSKAMFFETLELGLKHLENKVLIFEGSPVYCEKCGKQIFNRTDPPLCIVCASAEGKKGFFT